MSLLIRSPILSAMLVVSGLFLLSQKGAEGAASSYIFANPTGFGSMSVGESKTFDFWNTGDLKATLQFQGSEITLGTTDLNFETPGTINPSWMGGTRSMFRISYGGSASSGPKEFAKIEFELAIPLRATSYLLFTDFDSEEGLAIAAFDEFDNLIPYGAFTFARWDGEQVGGASLTTPNWLDENPTVNWETGNSGWVGTAAVSGYLLDTLDSPKNDAAVSLQSSIEIHRLVFYYNAETASTGSNSIRFNFAAVPEPASMCMFSALLAGTAIASRRRKLKNGLRP